MWTKFDLYLSGMILIFNRILNTNQTNDSTNLHDNYSEGLLKFQTGVTKPSRTLIWCHWTNEIVRVSSEATQKSTYRMDLRVHEALPALYEAWQVDVTLIFLILSQNKTKCSSFWDGTERPQKITGLIRKRTEEMSNLHGLLSNTLWMPKYNFITCVFTTIVTFLIHLHRCKFSEISEQQV